MALKEKADKDLSQYNTELKELMRIIEHDRKLKEFMRIKSEERAEIMESELSSQRKKKDEKERGDKAEETIEVCTCGNSSQVVWHWIDMISSSDIPPYIALTSYIEAILIEGLQAKTP